MKIENPYPKADCRVYGDIEEAPFNYFFRGALAGQRGPREAMIAIFFKAIYEACLEQQIPAHFELDNEHRIARLLAGINFNGDDYKRLLELERLAATFDKSSSDSSPPSTPLPSDKPRVGRGNAPGRSPKVRSKPAPTSTVPSNT